MGDKYEAPCVKMKNSDGPPPKGAKGVKAASKAKAKAAPKAKATKAKAAPAKAGSKRKKRGDDDDDDAQELNPLSCKAWLEGCRAYENCEKEKEEGKEGKEGDHEEEPAGESVPESLLANKWDLDTGLEPTGWWISEARRCAVCITFRFTFPPEIT